MNNNEYTMTQFVLSLFLIGMLFLLGAHIDFIFPNY